MTSSTAPMELLRGALVTIFHELVDGAPADACWVLNPQDPGLHASLDKLSAEAASAIPPTGGASIAAHAEHLRYGLDLINRYAGGESNPFADADWSAAWRRTRVSEPEWAALRDAFRAQTRRWVESMDAASQLPQPNSFIVTGMIASVVHLAYHMGAVRQIDRSIRGPAATG
jgi:uncharacterized damage-inducible protein DinB